MWECKRQGRPPPPLDVCGPHTLLTPPALAYAPTTPTPHPPSQVFGVPGVGTVVAGTVKRGVLTPASALLLGPDIGDGSFKARTGLRAEGRGSGT